MERQQSIPVYVGVGLAAVGFVLIGLGWDGASSFDFVQGQFPYLLSGGIGGLGLIVVGVMVLVIHTLRLDAERRSQELGELRANVEELVRLLSPPDEFDPTIAGEYRPRPRATAGASNGSGEVTTAATGSFERPA